MMSGAGQQVDVSIIIPHFNRAELLRETVDSVRKQSFSDWEVIIVDDGSTSEEFRKTELLRCDRVCVIQRSDGCKGPSRCRNLGVAAACGAYVMFLDSDDLLAPWCLEERLSRIQANSEAAFCVFPVMLFEKTPGDTAYLWNKLDGAEDLLRFLRSDPPWHTSSPLWRRSAFLAIGGFNEKVMYGDDSDLHMKALLARLSYQKYADVLPDVFVRRAEQARITNTISEALLDSRPVRLAEGSKLVKRLGSECQRREWEGQYIVEAEFLLFNVPQSQARQNQVLTAWRETWQPSCFRQFVAHAYLRIAQATKQNCYLILRVARRAAMCMLPNSFFPDVAKAEPAILENGEWTKVVEFLKRDHFSKS